MTQREAVLTLYLIAGALGVIAIFVTQASVLEGYIAGGALAAIVIAILQGVPLDSLINFNTKIDTWANTSNPLHHGDWANTLSLIPFFILMVLLYLVGRELILKGKPETRSER